MAGQLTAVCFPEFYNLELIQAANITHNLAKHVHEVLCVGIIETGARALTVRGSKQYAAAGQLFVINPGEVHDGASADGPYSYQIVCLEMSSVRALIKACTGQEVGDPYFKDTVIDDKISFYNFLKFARFLSLPATRLERETMLLDFFSPFLWYANEKSVIKEGHEHSMVEKVKDYVEAYYAEDILLEEIARAVNFSPYYLHHVFTKEAGMPLRAYQIFHRINKAKELLCQGMTFAEVAQQTGFVDQSHFCRRFKDVIGLTPGQWVKARM